MDHQLYCLPPLSCFHAHLLALSHICIYNACIYYYTQMNMSVPSTVRFLETSTVSTILPVPVLKYDAWQMYIPPSLHLAWLMVSEMKFWEMLPSTVPITELAGIKLGFPLFWSDPAETTSARGALGLLCNTRKMTKPSKVRTPVDGGSHLTVTVPPLDVVLGVRFSCVGVTVILGCPWPAHKAEVSQFVLRSKYPMNREGHLRTNHVHVSLYKCCVLKSSTPVYIHHQITRKKLAHSHTSGQNSQLQT